MNKLLYLYMTITWVLVVTLLIVLLTAYKVSDGCLKCLRIDIVQDVSIEDNCEITFHESPVQFIYNGKVFDSVERLKGRICK